MNQGYEHIKAALTALALGLAASTAAFAEVYSWTDENGVTHFSQTPPPAGQEAKIEDVPDGRAAPPADDAGSNFEPLIVPEDPEMSAADLRRQELAEAREQRQAERQATEEMCRQARERLAQIEPNRRVYYTDESGETVRMDDEERVAEVEQLHSFLDDNCP